MGLFSAHFHTIKMTSMLNCKSLKWINSILEKMSGIIKMETSCATGHWVEEKG